MSCSLPQGIAGVFLEGCCPPGHHKCSLVWHCKLVLYTAVTEQSWWHPFCTSLRGDIIIIFASSFCVLVLCSSSPNTPWHSRRPWVTSSLFFHHLDLSSFVLSPGVQLCIPEWTRWLWSAVIWLFALQPFWNKAKELHSPERVSYWCLEGTPAQQYLVQSWAGMRDLTVQTPTGGVHRLYNERKGGWLWRESALLYKDKIQHQLMNLSQTNGNAISWNNDERATR